MEEQRVRHLKKWWISALQSHSFVSAFDDIYAGERLQIVFKKK